MPRLKIAIIGGGPAGLLLARLLLHQSPPSLLTLTVFESERSTSSRSQGGTLDLHPRTGIAALKLAGLYAHFLAKARYDGSYMKLCDKLARSYLEVPASSNSGRPEIDRKELRRILVESLPKGTVEWGKKLVEIREGTGMECVFAEGDVRGGWDFVVGADGGWSRVRCYLDEETKPQYVGMTGYFMTVVKSEDQGALRAASFVHRGSVFAYSDGKSLRGQQLGDGSLDVAVWKRQECLMHEHEHDLPTVEQLCEEYTEWSPELLNLVRASSGVEGKRNSYALPEGFRWKHRDGVTVIGDAAHLMPPFAGEGVNLAFADATKLSQAILESIKSEDIALGSSVALFEEDMFKRAASARAMTMGMMKDMFFTTGAPRTSVHSWVLRRIGHDVSAWLYPLAAVAVYIWFFCFRLWTWRWRY